jgi:Tfp pilus assembly protein PilN
MLRSPNLARRPFVNRRPVQRTALILAIAGGLLLLVNLWLYVGYARTRSSNATQLNEIEARITQENENLVAADRTLASADLRLQNELVWFLNQRIDERSFGWSVLFDRLAGLLPADVRLNSLSPQFSRDEARREARGGNFESDGEHMVLLGIQGTARDGDAVLELVDALFADPAFRDPNLSQENQTSRGEISFSLSTLYLPHTAEALVAGQLGEETADDGAAEDGDDGDGEDEQDDDTEMST